jgi:hypothetical protein
LAFLMKQSGIFFAPLALCLLAFDQLSLKPRRPARFAVQALTLGAGALVPILLTAAYYLSIGKLSLFWFWTFKLAGEFAGQVGPAAAVKYLHHGTRQVIAGFELLWTLALVGLIATLRDGNLGKNRYLYATFGAACVLSIVPGFFFTNHYYVTVLAAIALFVGALGGGVLRGGQVSGRFAQAMGVWTFIGIGLVVGIGRYGAYYSGQASDASVSRLVYSGNPFPESVAIGEYLKDHTTPRDMIAMLGSETQILFYAQRRSASRFVNAYFLTANHPRNREMQREMIRDIERERPKYIVFARFPMSWSLLKNSPQDILDWFEKFGHEHYELEGLLVMDKGGSVMKWGADARSQPIPPTCVEILRRLDSSSIPGL